MWVGATVPIGEPIGAGITTGAIPIIIPTGVGILIGLMDGATATTTITRITIGMATADIIMVDMVAA